MPRRMLTVLLTLALLPLLAACPPEGSGGGGSKPGVTQHIVIKITADQYSPKIKNLKPTNGRPFTIWLDGDVDGVKGAKLETGTPFPWRSMLLTPHIEHIYVKPGNRLAHWHVAVAATTHEIRGPEVKTPPGHIFCRIEVNGRLLTTKKKALLNGGNRVDCSAAGTVGPK